MLLRALLALALACAGIQAVSAEPSGGTLKSIKARGAMVVGYLADAFPMSFTDNEGKAAEWKPFLSGKWETPK